MVLDCFAMLCGAVEARYSQEHRRGARRTRGLKDYKDPSEKLTDGPDEKKA